MDASSDPAQRLREKIRAKREERPGTCSSSSSTGPKHPPSREELSARVEEALKREFGDNPTAMEMAKGFIDNPMSVLQNLDTDIEEMEKKMSPDEKELVSSILKGEEEEEAPPV